MMHYEESLEDDYTLMDLAYIYTWRRNEPMRLFYRIYQRQKKTSKTDPTSTPPPPPPPPSQGAPVSALLETKEQPEVTFDVSEQNSAPSQKESGPLSTQSECLSVRLPDIPSVQPGMTSATVERKQTTTAVDEEIANALTSGNADEVSSKPNKIQGLEEPKKANCLESTSELYQDPARVAVKEMPRISVKRPKPVGKDPSRVVAKNSSKAVATATTCAKENKESPRLHLNDTTAKEPTKDIVNEPIRTIVKVPTKVLTKEARKVPVKQAAVKETLARDSEVKPAERMGVPEQTKTGVCEHLKGVSKELSKLIARNVTVTDVKTHKLPVESVRSVCLPRPREITTLSMLGGTGIKPESSDRSKALTNTKDVHLKETTSTVSKKTSVGSAASALVPSAPSQSSAALAATPVAISPSPPVPCVQASVPTQATTASVPEPAQTPFRIKEVASAPPDCPALPVRILTVGTSPSHRKEIRKLSSGVKERKHSSDHRQHHHIPEKKKKRVFDAGRSSLEEKRKKQKRVDGLSDHLIALPCHAGANHFPCEQRARHRQELESACSPPPVSSPKQAEPPVADASPASAPVPGQPPIAPVTVVLDRKHKKILEPTRDHIGALDLSLSHRSQQAFVGQFRPRHVANPAVLDKHRLITCLPAPKYPSYKIVCPSPMPSSSSSASKKSDGNRYRCKTLTVINPDPTRIVIKNLDLRRDNYHHSHHHHRH